MGTQYFWLNQRKDSGYADEIGDVYHYRSTTPSAQVLSEGDRFIYYMPGEHVFFGAGTIDHIDTESSVDEGKIHDTYYAYIGEYCEFDRSLNARTIKDDIPFLRRRKGLLGVPQSGIRQLEKGVFHRIIEAACANK